VVTTAKKLDTCNLKRKTIHLNYICKNFKTVHKFCRRFVAVSLSLFFERVDVRNSVHKASGIRQLLREKLRAETCVSLRLTNHSSVFLRNSVIIAIYRLQVFMYEQLFNHTDLVLSYVNVILYNKAVCFTLTLSI
jgi:hypothetical protein